jgi:hypothetical protein
MAEEITAAAWPIDLGQSKGRYPKENRSLVDGASQVTVTGRFRRGADRANGDECAKHGSVGRAPSQSQRLKAAPLASDQFTVSVAHVRCEEISTHLLPQPLRCTLGARMPTEDKRLCSR